MIETIFHQRVTRYRHRGDHNKKKQKRPRKLAAATAPVTPTTDGRRHVGPARGPPSSSSQSDTSTQRDTNTPARPPARPPKHTTHRERSSTRTTPSTKPLLCTYQVCKSSTPTCKTNAPNLRIFICTQFTHKRHIYVGKYYICIRTIHTHISSRRTISTRTHNLHPKMYTHAISARNLRPKSEEKKNTHNLHSHSLPCVHVDCSRHNLQTYICITPNYDTQLHTSTPVLHAHENLHTSQANQHENSHLTPT